MSSHSVTSPADQNGVEETLDAHTTILRWIAGLLTAGAAWMLAPILVPFVLALALAISLSPLARRRAHGRGTDGFQPRLPGAGHGHTHVHSGNVGLPGRHHIARIRPLP